jgi:hypothetical protein
MGRAPIDLLSDGDPSTVLPPNGSSNHRHQTPQRLHCQTSALNSSDRRPAWPESTTPDGAFTVFGSERSRKNSVGLETRVIVRCARDEVFGACLGKGVNTLDGYPGLFSLAVPFRTAPCRNLVQFNVSVPNLLTAGAGLRQPPPGADIDGRLCAPCGHTGALKLLDLGYAGPLAGRLLLAACARSKASRRADAARPTTELMHRR